MVDSEIWPRERKSKFRLILASMTYAMMARIIIIGFLGCLVGCAITPHQPELLYSIPAISYLRETPQYDSHVVAELYAADQVKLLNKSDGWWQVQSLRNEKIGWTQRDLLSEVPIIAKKYYITADGVPLRDAPHEDITSRNLLSMGEQVQKLEQKGGWWCVLVMKDKAIGWIPAKMASETWPEPSGLAGTPNLTPEKQEKAVSPGTPSHQPNHYFVAAGTLPMHIIPLKSSQVVKVLALNSEVLEISRNDSGWVKIRYLDTGAEGWSQARYLKTSPVTKKSQIMTERKFRKKEHLRKPPSKGPSETKGLEPEGM
jgi:uncharacterized protein YgiM (DUF1202 family)